MQLKLAAATPGVTAASIGVFVGIVGYMAFHALSYGPITWLVLAEIFPSNIRGKAMGIATMVNRGTSFVVAYTFLTMCERLEWSGTFYLYAAMAAASFMFYGLFVPETAGVGWMMRSLSSLRSRKSSIITSSVHVDSEPASLPSTARSPNSSLK